MQKQCCEIIISSIEGPICLHSVFPQLALHWSRTPAINGGALNPVDNNSTPDRTQLSAGAETRY